MIFEITVFFVNTEKALVVEADAGVPFVMKPIYSTELITQTY